MYLARTNDDLVDTPMLENRYIYISCLESRRVYLGINERVIKSIQSLLLITRREQKIEPGRNVDNRKYYTRG